MPEVSLRPRAGTSGKALLLTLLGEYVLPHQGSAWTSTIVSSLGMLDVEERNARQALARLADDDVVRSAKIGRRSQWHLTAHGRELLTIGTERIYAFGAGGEPWDGRWLVVYCSVPEEQRAKRHQLRSQLSFAGFGFLGPGIAISPHLERETLANNVLKALGLVPGSIVLRAEPGELVSAGELLERAWDLGGLASFYNDFVKAFARRSPRSDEGRFVALTELVHAWRHFPFVDPEIPRELLPRHWPGRRAKDLFDRCHATWAPSANLLYEQFEASS